MAERIICWIFSLFVPVILAGIGLLFMKCPIKSINSTCGYRTKRSMSSQKAWDFANTQMGKVYLIAGLILAGIAVLSNLIFGAKYSMLLINEVLAVIGCFSPLFVIEPALKKLILEEENETSTENA